MTDKEKLIELFKLFGLKADQKDYDFNIDESYMDEDSIRISPDSDFQNNNSKIQGDAWASTYFVFDKDGKFKNIQMNGD